MKKLKILLQCNKFFIMAFIIISIYVFYQTRIIKYNSLYNINDTVIEGKILEYDFKEDKLRLLIKSKEKIIVYYYFKSDSEYNELFNIIHLGDYIRVEGNINNVSNNTIPNAFNYKNYLYNNKIYYTFSTNKIDVLKNGNILDNIKDMLIKKIYDLNNREYYFLFLMGNKSLLDNNEYHSYQINGISHLLAISGMHLGIILTLLNVLFQKLNKYIHLIVLVIVLVLFGFLTSFPASLLRASIFVILQFINTNWCLRFNNIELLFITLYIILIINPFMIYNTGLIYSFIITLGIIIKQDKIKGNYFWKIFKISFYAFIFSLPITAMLNYEINILSIFLNIFFVPYVSLIVYPIAIISFLLPGIGIIFNLTLNIMKFLNEFLSNISLLINIGKIPVIGIIIYYLGLLIIKDVKKLLLFIIVFIISIKALPIFDRNYYVYFLDVGQGDSAVIITPQHKKTIMIDTGGKVSFNKKVNSYLSDEAITFLKSLGITKLDYLIISHGDFDHMGEAINLVNDFKVKKVIFNCGLYNNLEKDLIEVLDKKKISHYLCIKELNIDNNKLYFLQTKEYDNENDNSNVIYTELNGYKFMFMGDASSTTEKEIMSIYSLPNIDVLKVGHHGSKTSSSEEFIDEINSKYSIISVGKNNRYGHPNKEVLDNLDKSKIYRTDEDGSIMFKIKNNKINVETCAP